MWKIAIEKHYKREENCYRLRGFVIHLFSGGTVGLRVSPHAGKIATRFGKQ